LLDNVYLILPLIRNAESAEKLQSLLKNLLSLLFVYNNPSSGKELQIDQVNVNALFNDQSLLKELLVAFINILISCEEENDSNS
jgi:hypothetical protein